MSTRFTALTVREGDAFLLEDNGRNYLFDSGNDKSIVDLLKYKGIDKLNLAICSHNDADHANGFVHLLTSDIQIDEIWLPGLWASVIQFVKENKINDEDIECNDEFYNGELDSLLSEEQVSCESFNDELSHCEEITQKDFCNFYKQLYYQIHEKPEYLGHFFSSILQKESNEEINEKRLKEFYEDKLEDYLGNPLAYRVARHLPRHPDTYSINTAILRAMHEMRYDRELYYDLCIKHDLDIKLERITEIANLACKHDCSIRWFKPTQSCSINDMGNGFVALNSGEMIKIRKPKSHLACFCLIQLTQENKYSLAFEYKKALPIIRFSADSKNTCQSKSPYPQNIIVTAPHHGSGANAIVYKQLKGDDIIWVRSDERSYKRPCQEFKLLANKYCLACRKFNFVSEISFEYCPYEQKWHHIHGEHCRCNNN